MLVFTRKRDEAIVIGQGIEIRVVRIGKDGVRIGITAPADIPVHRSEIYRLVESSNASAAKGTKTDATVVSSLAARLRGRASAAEPPSIVPGSPATTPRR